jgi:hypothetical protein
MGREGPERWLPAQTAAARDCLFVCGLLVALERAIPRQSSDLVTRDAALSENQNPTPFRGGSTTKATGDHSLHSPLARFSGHFMVGDLSILLGSPHFSITVPRNPGSSGALPGDPQIHARPIPVTAIGYRRTFPGCMPPRCMPCRRVRRVTRQAGMHRRPRSPTTMRITPGWDPEYCVSRPLARCHDAMMVATPWYQTATTRPRRLFGTNGAPTFSFTCVRQCDDAHPGSTLRPLASTALGLRL